MRSHARLLKLGVDQNPITATQLLQSYAGDSLAAARRVFDEVPTDAKDPILWTAIISVYARSHLPVHALRLFSLMPCPTPHACASAAFAAAYAHPLLVRSLHARFFTRGLLHSNVVVATSVVDAYAKNGDLDLSRKLFDEMPERNVVTWNSMVSGYVNAGMGDTALELFHMMRSVDFEVGVDRFTVSTVLTACAGLGDLHSGLQIHGYLGKAGFDWDPAVMNSLVNMYFRCGDVESAERSLIGSEHGIHSKLMMIKGYAFNEMHDLAIRSIPESGIFLELCKIDPSVVVQIITASANLGLLSIGRKVHGLIITTGIYDRSRKLPGTHLVILDSALIDMYCKCFSIEEARILSHYISERHVSHWNAMLSGCIHNGLLEEAVGLFKEMQEKNAISWTIMISGYVQLGSPQEGLRLVASLYGENGSFRGDCFSLATALNACSCLAALEIGKQIHAHAIRTGAMHAINHVVTENALLDMYSKSGSLIYARRVFDRMQKKNVVSWTSMVTAYASHGSGHQAIEVLEQMISNDFRPNEVTFIAILSACSHCGLVDEALHYFNLMRYKYNITPTDDHYSCMIDMLGRAGKLAEAWKLMDEIEENETCGSGKDAASKGNGGAMYGALLGGCELHGNVDIGKKVAMRMLERREQSSETYIALSNVYAAAGMWEEVYRVREEWRKDTVLKDPGYSQIHMG